MEDYIGKKYQTGLKAEADIHAGGNFFWSLYKDELILNQDSTAQLKRIYLKNNGFDINKEKIILEGTHNTPQQGHYLFEVILNNENVQHKYCCEIIENDKLICHGFYQFRNTNNNTYITELFNII